MKIILKIKIGKLEASPNVQQWVILQLRRSSKGGSVPSKPPPTPPSYCSANLNALA